MESLQQSLITHVENFNLTEALATSFELVEYLNTNVKPKEYYQVYAEVFDSLNHFQRYLAAEANDLDTLYRKVQYNPKVLQRLYLMIVVGSVGVLKKEMDLEGTLADMLEMVKSIKNPIRGLFIRHFLNQMCKYIHLHYSVQFYLENLYEMAALLLRTGCEEEEKVNLRALIGQNIVRLSSLELMTPEMYKGEVLPQLIDVIERTKDKNVQQYLMDCLIQGFSVDLLVTNLGRLFEAVYNLEKAADVKSIFINILNRMADSEVIPESNSFALIKYYTDLLISQKHIASLKKHLDVLEAFVRFCGKFFSSYEHVSKVVKSCGELVENNKHKIDMQSIDSLHSVLYLISDLFSIEIFYMNGFRKLFIHLQPLLRKEIATKLCKNLIVRKEVIYKEKTLQKILDYAVESEDYLIISNLMHLLDRSDIEAYFRMLGYFENLSSEYRDLAYPSLVFQYIQLLNKFPQQQMVYSVLLKLTNSLRKTFPEVSIKLSVQCFLAIDHEEVAYDFISSALATCQEDLSNPTVKSEMVNLIIASLEHTDTLQDRNTPLIDTTYQLVSRQLQRTDQCRGISNMLHLFWKSKQLCKLAENLKTGIRLAEICSTSPKNFVIYVEILNSYIFFYERAVDGVEATTISAIIELIQEKFKVSGKEREEKSSIQQAVQYFQNTLLYIMKRKEEGKLLDINC